MPGPEPEKKQKPEAEAKEAPQAEEKKGPSPLIKKLILAGVILVVVLIEGIIAYTLVRATRQEDQRIKAQKEAEKQDAVARLQRTKMGITTEPIDVIVNIPGVGEDEGRYAKVAIQLEFDDVTYPELLPELDKRKAKIKNILIEELTKRTFDKLMSFDGKVALRNDIKREVNNTIPKEKGSIENVYLSEFVIQ
jgi:flagellar FliL protein